MESIIEYLRRKLHEAGPARWELIAAHCGIAKTLPRKLAYADRRNPGVSTIQPLLDFFHAVDRGECQLPSPHTPARPAAEHGSAEFPTAEGAPDSATHEAA